jgi:glycosyltransferase involved in cell wall biosynthesis
MRSSLIRIGVFCPGDGTSGPWRNVHSILAELDAREFDVTVFCDYPDEYEPRPSIKVVRLKEPSRELEVVVAAVPGGQRVSEGARLSRLAPRPVRLWAGFGKQSRRLAKLIRQHPVDLFHTHNTGCEESPVAAKLAGVRHVIGTFHVSSAVDVQRLRSGPTHRLMEIVSNQCLSRAIAVSEDTKLDWVRRSHISADRVATIHNGIDPEKFRRRQSREAARQQLGLPLDALVVGGLGRLDEAKGFTYLIEAAATLRREFPTLVIMIAGSGPLRESLEHGAAKLGVSDIVRFVGFQSDVQLVLDALDVFALTSLTEALPYALLEAMATELPAVGSAVGGVPEVIVPWQTGFLVPARASDRLAVTLRTLLKDSEMRTRMGAAGRERVIRHFHERDMVRKTIDLYRRVCGCLPTK